MTEHFKIEMADGVDIAKAAYISDDTLYRYWLARVWDPMLPTMVYIMLNPSKADSEIDDPTILACCAIARSNSYGSILVCNLFAWRATSPADMKAQGEAAVGPDNHLWLSRVFTKALEGRGIVVAAWGAHGEHLDRDYEVAAAAERAGLTLYCLGKTKDGHPRHPLARGKSFVPRDFKPIPLRDAA